MPKALEASQKLSSRLQPSGALETPLTLRSEPLVCETCGKTFLRRGNLNRHLKTHTRPYYCDGPGCTSSFSLQADLTRHQKTKHAYEADENKLFCPTPGCKFSEGQGKWFTRADTRARHMKTHESMPSGFKLLTVDPTDGVKLIRPQSGHAPPYAILSHTWGAYEDEISFEDITKRPEACRGKPGYQKLLFCHEQAARDKLDYFWIDTCCIDRVNSPEMTEAINSMFQWYQESSKCYVYLSDVSTGEMTENTSLVQSEALWMNPFRSSRWFTRGWTLGELLAPRFVEFFSKEGLSLGDKITLVDVIQDITSIPSHAITGAPLSEFDVEEKRSWASGRTTRRGEDAAYCMLGLFGVHIHPLYGEGQESALRRLDEEIRNSSKQDTGTRRQISADSGGNSNWSVSAKRPKLAIDPSTKPEMLGIILESLKFDEIGLRQLNTPVGHSNTGAWVLESPEFMHWFNIKGERDSQILWIKGKPGSGKSTLMKFAIARTRSRYKGSVMLSSFFNDRGTYLERSTIGAYRTILVQLLQQCPTLCSIINVLGPQATMILKHRQWTVELLRLLLEEAIIRLASTVVFCFIDATDECHEDEVRDLLTFLEHLLEKARTAGCHLRVCFSSRYYPYISIKSGTGISLESQQGHMQDIQEYLRSELQIGKSTTADQIRADVLEKSGGVFLWVVLVVEALNKEYDRGRVHSLNRRLAKIPNGLSDLIDSILTRGESIPEELSLSLQWVLFSREPLSARQFYFATLSGSPSNLPISSPHTVTDDDAARFILNTTKGLTEAKASPNGGSPAIQFIHESVRDHLLHSAALDTLISGSANGLEGVSHERLKECCHTYVMHGNTSSKTSGAMSEEILSKESLDERFPFLEYAVQNILIHADRAASFNIPQENWLRSFQSTNHWNAWLNVYNVYKKHGKGAHKADVSLVYLAAELDLPDLVRERMTLATVFEPSHERYGPPILAALANGSKRILKTILALCTVELDQEIVSSEYTQAVENSNDWESSIGPEFSFSCDRTTFSYLVEHVPKETARLLMRAIPTEAATISENGRQPLEFAASNGWEREVRLLLESGADVNAISTQYGSVLQVASRAGHVNVLMWLLRYGADVNFQGGEFGSAIQAASYGGHQEIVNKLCSCGAEVNAHTGNWGSALYIASGHGYRPIVRRLLDSGASVNAPTGKEVSAVQVALNNGHDLIAKLLVDNGAELSNSAEEAPETTTMTAPDQED